ncbi:uncharacterized protein LOC141728856 isoform X2 [Zonotrichia albicollis]|uniref:uncharacterized protein LOC141728856 isoform X2 n=1 Tax=Zonotrichia albicollis TaxID=44394 RepID=UPI003D81195E
MQEHPGPNGASAWEQKDDSKPGAGEEKKKEPPRLLLRRARQRLFHDGTSAAGSSVRGTKEENVLRSPGQTSNVGQWRGHLSLRPPCPPRPSRVPELRRGQEPGLASGWTQPCGQA